MKLKLLISSAAMFVATISANAADMVKHHPKHVKHIAPMAQVIIAPSAPAFSWVGPYLGIETGVVMTRFHPANGNEGLTNLLIKPKAQPAVGLFTGYNFALGRHAIFGIDNNIDYHAVESNAPNQPYIRYKESALAAARLRLGLAQGRIMPYIAGGLSAIRSSLFAVQNISTQNSNKQKIYLGWNVGGGMDFAVANNMLLRLDYRFSQIKIKDLYGVGTLNDLQRTDANMETKSHEIRVGAAYKF